MPGSGHYLGTRRNSSARVAELGTERGSTTRSGLANTETHELTGGVSISNHYRSQSPSPSDSKCVCATHPSSPPRGSAFTLIELLTVIAIIAVLASLLLTTLASAKKKSRTTACISNLHQLGLALNLYMDDTGTRPAVDNLSADKYLPPGKPLLCPEDKTGNWGRLLQSPPQPVTASNTAVQTYSYMLHPLIWDASLWHRVMQSPGTFGLAACELHGLGKQDVADVRNFNGLLLRVQKDAAVVKRQVFWNKWSLFGLPNLPPGTTTNQFYLYPLPAYVDDPAGWLQ